MTVGPMVGSLPMPWRKPDERRDPVYPWGKAAPSQYLKRASARTLKALEKAREPGFAQIESRVREVVEASWSLTETLNHLARNGSKRRGKPEPLDGEEVVRACDAFMEAVGLLSDSSPHDMSERYEGFILTLERLFEVAQEATNRGVRAFDHPDTPWPWK